MDLFDVIPVSRALTLWLERCPRPTPLEQVELLAAFGRVPGPLVAREDLPTFDRSTVDGWAVQASDTFGAGEGQPAWLVRG
ncbi:MAG: molybdopterin molybdenumtransferase MoeA, partial [Bacillota bacterium]